MTAAPAERALPVSVREKGYADDASVSGDWYTQKLREATVELRWPDCIQVYDNMRRQDAQVGSVLRAVTSPILQTTWSIDGTDCDKEVVDYVSTSLGLPVVGQDKAPAIRGRQRFSFTEHLRLALLCLPFGHMFFEQVYYPPDDNGHYRLRKLGPRMHRTIAGIKTARDGGLVALQQHAPGYSGGIYYGGGAVITLPVNRLVAYVLDREGSDWLGTSILRPVFKNWLLKDELLRTQAMAYKRNGLGIPNYEAGSSDKAELDAAEEIVAGLQAGEDSGVVNPKGAKTSLMGTTGNVPDADGPIRYHDEQIARAVLAHVLNLGTQNGTGSWALGTTLHDVFGQAVAAIAELIRSTFSLHVIEDMVDLSFGPDVVAPKLAFGDIGAKQDAVIHAIAYLVSAGVLHPDENLERFVRTTLGVPAYDPTGVPTPTAPPLEEAS